jgi:hypothetical protein
MSSFQTHICPPHWEAIREDYDDPDDESTYRKAFGSDADVAAEDLVSRFFSDWDYPREVIVWVRKDASEPWRKFEVSVEPVPSFSAVEIKNTDEAISESE